MQTISCLSIFLSGALLFGTGPAIPSRNAGIGGEVAGVMKAESAKQGKIIGVAGAGKSGDGVNVIGFKMGQETPEDPGSGNTPGVRKHHFVVVTKAIDASSPEFQRAFDGKEVLKSVVIQLTKKTPDSKHKAGTTITLTDVVIAGVRKGGSDLDPWHLEEIKYSFKGILVQYSDGSTSTSDDVSAHDQ